MVRSVRYPAAAALALTLGAVFGTLSASAQTIDKEKCYGVAEGPERLRRSSNPDLSKNGSTRMRTQEKFLVRCN